MEIREGRVREDKREEKTRRLIKENIRGVAVKEDGEKKSTRLERREEKRRGKEREGKKSKVKGREGEGRTEQSKEEKSRARRLEMAEI